MANQRDPMIDMYVHETFQLLEQLENVILDSEKSDNMKQAINEIFRVMHTIKGNSMMMKYDNIASLAHVTEDLFDYLRTNEPQNINYSQITDIVLESVDFFKDEVTKIQNNTPSSEEAEELKEVIVDLLESFKFMDSGEAIEIEHEEEKPQEKIEADEEKADRQVSGQYENLYYVKVVFEEDSQMENIRSFSIVHNLDEFGCDIYHYPEDLEDMEEGLTRIKDQGFQMILNCKQNISELKYYFERVSFLKELELKEISEEEFESYRAGFKHHESNKAEEIYETENKEIQLENTEQKEVDVKSKKTTETKKEMPKSNNLEQTQIKQQKYINVDVDKLDLLMNLVGELVVSEAMVTQNPELKSLNIQSIEKAAGQMRKIINEIQDNVMEIRMVPLSMTFQRMNRIVRDMSVKTNKDVDLVLIGQETEVDKNIIEHIADPLMHLIRNAIDHGIESPEERKRNGKEEKGTVTLEAKNAGGDVWIIVRDDGEGLDRNSILRKADERGLLKKPIEEYSDKEAFALIFEAGLSTKQEVTNFSGRGVGMDAVVKELEKIGGIVVVESEKGQGTSMILRIPLTLAIINGMVMNVGDNKFTLPITSIRESFKAKRKDIIEDSDQNAMIMVRGECYSIVRIHERYGLQTDITDFEEGIFVMLENEDYKACLFVDQLIGEHQVVVKSFSKYIKKIKGISGCAHLGDGGICLILDPSGLIA
ncbi:MAG: chemotaxis protein CheA [Clostridia bacterium]|nr:chemotaxis protein CheA [Clostridia bacterium]